MIAWRDNAPIMRQGAPMMNEHGQREWVVFNEPVVNGDDDFLACGEEFLSSVPSSQSTWLKSTVGDADALLIDANAIVDFAVDYFRRTRLEMRHLQ